MGQKKEKKKKIYTEMKKNAAKFEIGSVR